MTRLVISTRFHSRMASRLSSKILSLLIAQLLDKYTDADMHNITAYLATLK